MGRQLAKSRATELTAAKTQLESTSALVALVTLCLLCPGVLRGGLCGSVSWRQDWCEFPGHQQAPRLCDGDTSPRLGRPGRVAVSCFCVSGAPVVPLRSWSPRKPLHLSQNGLAAWFFLIKLFSSGKILAQLAWQISFSFTQGLTL